MSVVHASCLSVGSTTSRWLESISQPVTMSSSVGVPSARAFMMARRSSQVSVSPTGRTGQPSSTAWAAWAWLSSEVAGIAERPWESPSGLTSIMRAGANGMLAGSFVLG
jgi:hypothetical protein